MLTCSGCVIDQCQLLLHLVQHNLVRDAVRVAMLWERRLEEKTRFDVDTLNENDMVPLTWYSSQKLNQGIQLNFTQHSTEFDVWSAMSQSLEGVQLPSSLPNLVFGNEFGLNSWPNVKFFRLLCSGMPQSLHRGHPTTQQPAEFDVW